jgi:hypothetical protein
MFINNGISDARFWLFRTARLAATVKAPPSTCLSAGILVNDGSFLTSGAAYHTSVFFYRTHQMVASGQGELRQIVAECVEQGKIIGGFGRVLARGADERNPNLLQLAKECGLAGGPYLQQAFTIERLLQELKDERLFMNSAGLGNALLLDMEFTPQEIMLFASYMFVIGMSGNIVEAYGEAPGTYLAISDDDITYTGPSLRRSPRGATTDQQILTRIHGVRVVTMDSISYLQPENRGDVIICGSHGAVAAAQYVVAFSPRAVVFSDAGKGKDGAGISGLEMLDEHGIAALAVGVDSARIGDGQDIAENGLVSALNGAARSLGVKLSMTVMEAVATLLNTKDRSIS